VGELAGVHTDHGGGRLGPLAPGGRKSWEHLGLGVLRGCARFSRTRYERKRILDSYLPIGVSRSPVRSGCVPASTNSGGIAPRRRRAGWGSETKRSFAGSTQECSPMHVRRLAEQRAAPLDYQAFGAADGAVATAGPGYNRASISTASSTCATAGTTRPEGGSPRKTRLGSPAGGSSVPQRSVAPRF
jgi:hypothetical protein